jgi:SAM-dependent methyltransferase
VQTQELDERLQSLAGLMTSLRSELRKASVLPPVGGNADGEANSFDAYYRRFEDHFRGSPEQIRERLSFYLPILDATGHAGIAHAAARFVDIGSGRGEMIGMLRERGIDAYGVDNSENMVAQCRDRGLTVVHADAIEHLTSLDPASLAGITSIHVIEHLPFRALMTLFQQAFRVLCPGGVAIFETPNPENLIVGACNFYYDPTHMRPLPPEPTRFLLESCGFERVAIERLHSGATLAQVDAAADPVAKLYSAIMLVPQDYALIAYKPAIPETA